MLLCRYADSTGKVVFASVDSSPPPVSRVAPRAEPVSPTRSGHALVGALLLAAAAFASAKVGALGNGQDRDAADFRAPLVLNAPAGSKELVLSELKGRAVVLDFWASWCGPCRAEAPVLQRLHERYAAEGLAVVGVNTSDEEGAAAPTARHLRLTFPIVYDDAQRVAKLYGVTGLPTLVVISKTGKIVAIRSGTTSEAALEELVRKALAS